MNKNRQNYLISSPDARLAKPRVLIIYAGHIGDLVMATPVLEHLRCALGNSVCIDWLARSSCGEIFERDPRINRIFILNHMMLPLLLNWPKLKVIFHSWLQPYDFVITLNFGEANSLMCAIRGQQKIKPGVNKYGSNIHKVEAMQGFYLKELFPGQSIPFLAPTLNIPHIPRTEQTLDLPEQFLVLVVTISKYKSRSKSGFKSWPMAHWKMLIEQLLKSYSGKIVLTHAPKERQAIEALLQEFHPRVQTLSPKLADLASILKRADAVVSADTGPAHIANAIGTPTVTLFGPTRPEKTGPYKLNKSAVIMKVDLDCIGCLLQTPCTANRCMQELTPTEVCKTLLGLINETNSVAE